MKIFVLIFFIPIMVTCNPLDELTPTYEYQNLPYNKAVKYIKDLPPDASDVYVKKHSTIDSAIIFIRFTFKSGKSLQNYLALKGRSLNLRKVPVVPARWPDYNNLSFSSKPAWWNPALKEIYIFESWVNSGSFHQDRSEGRAYFPDYSEKVIFIWYWNIQWWGIR